MVKLRLISSIGSVMKDDPVPGPRPDLLRVKLVEGKTAGRSERCAKHVKPTVSFLHVS